MGRDLTGLRRGRAGPGGSCRTPAGPPSLIISQQVRDGGFRWFSQTQKCNARDDEYPQDLAVRAPQKPLPHQRRENHAGYHH